MLMHEKNMCDPYTLPKLLLSNHDTDPYRAYFCGVFFRKLKSGDSEEMNQGSLEGYVDGLFFNKDQSNLQEMIDIIPPGSVF